MRLFFLAVPVLALCLAGCAGSAYAPNEVMGPPYAGYSYPYPIFAPGPPFFPYGIVSGREHHAHVELHEERDEHESAQEEQRETPQQERQEEHKEHEHGKR